MLDGEFFIAGEMQPFAFQAFAHQAGKPRFENAHMALLQQLDFFLVNVHADHIVADFGQDGGLHQADITTTKYTDFHEAFLSSGALARRELMMMTPEDDQRHPEGF